MNLFKFTKIIMDNIFDDLYNISFHSSGVVSKNSLSDLIGSKCEVVNYNPDRKYKIAIRFFFNLNNTWNNRGILCYPSKFSTIQESTKFRSLRGIVISFEQKTNTFWIKTNINYGEVVLIEVVMDKTKEALISICIVRELYDFVKEIQNKTILASCLMSELDDDFVTIETLQASNSVNYDKLDFVEELF